MPRTSKPIYRVTVELRVEVDINITADNVQQAVELAAKMNTKEIIKPADSSCEFVDWANNGVKGIAMDGYVPFKS